MHGPPVALAFIGINAAIFVIALVLGVLVPMVLVVLSLFFGAPLRRAAESVRHASIETQAGMRQFLHYLLHGAAAPEPVERVRVETPDEPKASARPKVRVTHDDSDVIDTTATENPRRTPSHLGVSGFTVSADAPHREAQVPAALAPRDALQCASAGAAPPPLPSKIGAASGKNTVMSTAVADERGRRTT